MKFPSAAMVRERMLRDDPLQLDRAEARLELIRASSPTLVQSTLADAELAMRNLHVLPGTLGKPRFLGDPIDWYTDLVGDAEFIITLNRMFHWPTLLRAHALTGEAWYVDKVLLELSDWMSRCVRPAVNPESTNPWNGSHPWCLLDVGLRMARTWATVHDYLLPRNLMDEALFARFVQSHIEHAEALVTMSPKLWPHADHNHYIMEMLGLLSISVRLPELGQSARWRETAIRELERCCAAQFVDGGGQIEGCPHYHNVVVSDLLEAFKLVGTNAFSPSVRDQLERMMTYSLHAMRPNGLTVPWGDSDAIYKPIEVSIKAFDCLRDARWLALARDCAGAQTVSSVLWKYAWNVDDVQGVIDSIESAVAPSSMLSLTHLARGTEQAMLRTRWSSDAISVFVGCRSPVNNGHAHIDPGGFDFCALGRAMLVDPGRYTYRQDASRYEFKRGASHNCLLINDRDPFEYRSTWEFGPQSPGRMIRVDQTPFGPVAVCEHETDTHRICRRLVAIVNESFLLVVDHVTDLSPDDTVDIYFHYDTTDVALEAHRWGHQTLARFESVRLDSGHSPGPAAQILPGRVSVVSDAAHESRRLHLHDTSGAAVRTFASAFVPRRTATPAEVSVSLAGGVCSVTVDSMTTRIAIEPLLKTATRSATVS